MKTEEARIKVWEILLEQTEHLQAAMAKLGVAQIEYSVTNDEHYDENTKFLAADGTQVRSNSLLRAGNEIDPIPYAYVTGTGDDREVSVDFDDARGECYVSTVWAVYAQNAVDLILNTDGEVIDKIGITVSADGPPAVELTYPATKAWNPPAAPTVDDEVSPALAL